MLEQTANTQAIVTLLLDKYAGSECVVLRESVCV